jgi:hypothetical protein
MFRFCMLPRDVVRVLCEKKKVVPSGEIRGDFGGHSSHRRIIDELAVQKRWHALAPI